MSYTRQQHTPKYRRKCSNSWWKYFNCLFDLGWIENWNDTCCFWRYVNYLHSQNSTIFWLICKLYTTCCEQHLFSAIFFIHEILFIFKTKKNGRQFHVHHHQNIRTPSLSQWVSRIQSHRRFWNFNVTIWEKPKQQEKTKLKNIKIRPNVQRQFECVCCARCSYVRIPMKIDCYCLKVNLTLARLNAFSDMRSTQQIIVNTNTHTHNQRYAIRKKEKEEEIEFTLQTNALRLLLLL